MRDELSQRPQFTINVGNGDGSCRVRLDGELDIACVFELERALRSAEAGAAETIVVDLDGLTFIDASGLRTLLRARARAARGSKTLKFTRGNGHVAEVLEMMGVARFMPVVEDAR